MCLALNINFKDFPSVIYLLIFCLACQQSISTAQLTKFKESMGKIVWYWHSMGNIYRIQSRSVAYFYFSICHFVARNNNQQSEWKEKKWLIERKTLLGLAASRWMKHQIATFILQTCGLSYKNSWIEIWCFIEHYDAVWSTQPSPLSGIRLCCYCCWYEIMIIYSCNYDLNPCN